MSKKKFKGTLGKKHSRRQIGLLASEGQSKKIIQDWIDEDSANIQLLCEEFGVKVDNNMWRNLVFALCHEYVPAFQEAPLPATKWTDLRRGYLVVAMQREIAARSNCTQAEAAEALSCREPWQSFVEPRTSDDTPNRAESIRFQYKKFKDNKWAKIAQDAFACHQHLGTIDQWDSELLEAFGSDNASNSESPTEIGKFLRSPPPTK